VTARASDSMFLFIDFVRVTNCFYDYDFYDFTVWPNVQRLAKCALVYRLITYHGP